MVSAKVLFSISRLMPHVASHYLYVVLNLLPIHYQGLRFSIERCLEIECIGLRVVIVQML